MSEEDLSHSSSLVPSSRNSEGDSSSEVDSEVGSPNPSPPVSESGEEAVVPPCYSSVLLEHHLSR